MAAGILGGIVASILPGVLPSIADTAKILVDRLVPDPAARAQAAKELEEVISAREAAIASAVQSQNEAQNAINLAEAQGNDRYSSRWRPTLGWLCVWAFGYQFLAAPIITWLGSLFGVAFGFSFPAPPTLTTSDFMPLLLGMLGLTASRSYERASGVGTAVPPQLAPMTRR